jgi:hypothetical protein
MNKKYSKQLFIDKIRTLFKNEVELISDYVNTSTKCRFREPDLNFTGKFVEWEAAPKNLLKGHRSPQNKGFRFDRKNRSKTMPISKAIEIAKSCKYLSEFKLMLAGKAYERLRKTNKYKEYICHLTVNPKKIVLDSHKIYGFFFSDSFFYIGQTVDVDTRRRKHLSSHRSPVFKHILKNRCFFFRVLESNIATKYVKEREDFWQKHFSLLIPLHSAIPGALGRHNTKWSESLIRDIFSRHNSVISLFKESQEAYSQAKRRGIYEDVSSHFIRKNSWTNNKIIEMSKQYISISQLRKSNNCLYSAIYERGLQSIAFSHIKTSKYYCEISVDDGPTCSAAENTEIRYTITAAYRL